jgi:uncharacterized 2Fe-2S/4Fe-4S cluster protein (DUF4445 family)
MEVFFNRLKALALDHSPLVEAVDVTVSRPTLRDNSGLADRMAREAAKTLGLDRIFTPPSVAAGLNRLYADHGYDVRAVVYRDGNIGRVVAVESRETGGLYGLVVDIGSTTLVMGLVDLVEAKVIHQITRPNPQTEFGADILTRAHMADKPDGLKQLSASLRDGINRGVKELCEYCTVEAAQITSASMAGNTSMTHFLLGLPLSTVIREPYVPVLNRPDQVRARDIDLGVAPEAPVWIMPNKGAYFGGDLIAGLVTAGFESLEEPCLLVDVGTNAEVVLGQKDWMIGAAGAAGPALEGGVAAMGMVAQDGAIDRVRIDRESKRLTYHTIGDTPARGICGSGLIDLFAELFLSGLIDFRGKITLPEGHERRVETDEGPAFVVVPESEADNGRAITLSEVELDILTRSKAGMYTILSTVMKSVGLTFDQLEKFFVAGTFGQYIDPQMAVAVGMVPDIPLDRFVPLGNSSFTGAVLALLSSGARKAALRAFEKLTYLEMNVNQDLMNRFSAARFIPHTDRDRFPSVGRTII